MRGPIQRNTVSLNRTGHLWQHGSLQVFFGESVLAATAEAAAAGGAAALAKYSEALFSQRGVVWRVSRRVSVLRSWQ